MQDDNWAIQYNGWRGVIDTNASGGTYRVSKTAGDKVTYKFTGPSLQWVTAKGSNMGKAQILIDGLSKGTFDLYSPTDQWLVVPKTWTVSANKVHTLIVKVLGTKNTQSKGTNVAVDAFFVGSTTTPEDAPTVQYNKWVGVSNANASGGTYRSSNTAGALVSLTFTGTRIDWITATGPAYGKAEVWIDGVRKATVDLYAATPQWQVAKPYAGLSAGPHTIQIKVLGTKNLKSKGKAVVVDAFSGPITVTGTFADVEPEVEEEGGAESEP